MEFKSGNILLEDTEALVNTVNCVGIMGKGIALEFKEAFPENYKEYEKACKRGEVKPGNMFVFKMDKFTKPHYIINFPTKRHWKGKSRIEDIRAGLKALSEFIRENGITSVAVPPLGCGLGGLNWSEVKPMIQDAFKTLDSVRVTVFEPNGSHTAEAKTYTDKAPAMTAGRAALIELINRYLSGLLDPFVTLLEVHKLMYFLQEAGEPLRLKFEKAYYGPYAENLRHVLKRIEGYYISGYADGGDAPQKQLKLVPGAIDDAEIALRNNMDTYKHTNMVADLVEGFESPFGLELLSTVHWVITREHAHNINEVISKTYAWNEGKKKFTPRQITIAVETLVNKNWATLGATA